ncbi:hypothetical protein MIF8_5 [Erwinia phage MIF8]
MSDYNDYRRNWGSQFAPVEYVIGVPVELIDEIFPLIGSGSYTTYQAYGYVIYEFSMSAKRSDPCTHLAIKNIPFLSFTKTHYDIYDIVLGEFNENHEYALRTEYSVTGGYVRAISQLVRQGVFKPGIQASEHFRYKTLQLLKVKNHE